MEIVSLVTALGVSLGFQAGSPDHPSSARPAVVAGAVTGAPPQAVTDSATDSVTAARAPRWVWPLTPRPAVVHAFDPPEHRWEPGHRGVDLAASVGQQVLSPAPGEVAFAGMLAGRGVVVVVHANGLRSTFEPLDVGVPKGTVVVRGELIGRVATRQTHCEPAVCLHWGVLRGRDYLDPLAFVGRPPIVLLPLG